MKEPNGTDHRSMPRIVRRVAWAAAVVLAVAVARDWVIRRNDRRSPTASLTR